MLDYWSYTAQPSEYNVELVQTRYHYGPEEDAPKFKKSHGFCLNKRCKVQNDLVYKIANRDKHRNVFMTKDHALIECPHCNHCLFWTKNWKIIS